MHHIVLLLQGNVNDRVWDVSSADAVEELGLTDDDAKVRVKVDLVLALALDFLSEDGVLQFADCLVRLDLSPVCELLALIVLSQLLSKVDVALCNLLTRSRASQDLRLGLEAVNRSLHAGNDRPGPSNGT